jgi:tRNA threonylcarbamoyladenosine biosynthesis protein TsaB
MFILAVDTSGKHGSIALAQCEDQNCAIIDVIPLTGGTFSVQLVPQIAAMLAKNGFSKSDLGGFAVATGPGSFTGLRVGLAAIKGLAEVLGKPIAAISLLEGLAVAAGAQGRLTAALNAGRDEVYAGIYQVSDHAANRIEERVFARAEFLEGISGQTVVAADPEIVAEARKSGARVIEVPAIQSDTIARLGWRKIEAHDTISTEELEANYIRRSDAEIFSKLPAEKRPT